MLRFFIMIWLKYLYPAWNITPAWVESWFYDKRRGKDIFELLRGLAPDIGQMSNLMRARNFAWTSDPLGGVLDFRSFAWVTCVRGKGDCDDWSVLWYRLLRHHGKVEKVYTKKKGGGGHAMTLFTRDGMCYLMSNLRVKAKTSEYEKDKLLTAFFGDDTDFSILY